MIPIHKYVLMIVKFWREKIISGLRLDSKLNKEILI